MNCVPPPDLNAEQALREALGMLHVLPGFTIEQRAQTVRVVIESKGCANAAFDKLLTYRQQFFAAFGQRL